MNDYTTLRETPRDCTHLLPEKYWPYLKSVFAREWTPGWHMSVEFGIISMDRPGRIIVPAWRPPVFHLIVARNDSITAKQVSQEDFDTAMRIK